MDPEAPAPLPEAAPHSSEGLPTCSLPLPLSAPRAQPVRSGGRSPPLDGQGPGGALPEMPSPDLKPLTLMPWTSTVLPSLGPVASLKPSALLASSPKPKSLPQCTINNETDHSIYYNTLTNTIFNAVCGYLS